MVSFPSNLDNNPRRYGLGLEGYLILFAFYLVQYFVIIYANSALVGAALIRLKGGDPTVGDGFRIAGSRMGAIFGYAAISATVGLILRWFSERGSLGTIAASLFGLAWGLATFLAIPILPAFIVFVLLLIGLGLISSTLSGIFAAAVYSYATTGSTGGFFGEDLIRGAFRSKA